MNNEILLSFQADILNITGKNLKNGCVVAVGGFDGIHLGHVSLIKALTQQSDRLSVPSVVFTFDYNDTPKNKSQMLLSPNSAYDILAKNGVDIVVTVGFSSIKSVSAADFVIKYLYEGLNAKSVICGYDFRFGNNRVGNACLISRLLSPKGVSVISVPPFLFENQPVSATKIRSLIANGDIKGANRLLYQSFGFSGTVLHGAKLGRRLGFPTINQQYPVQMVKPPYGVYLTKVLLNGQAYYGVTNFGIKPTVSQNSALPTCETYVFNYGGDCYGSIAELYFLDYIRPEQRFSSVEELRLQVEKDKLSALQLLSKGELL